MFDSLVGETYFQREPQQWVLLRETILPDGVGVILTGMGDDGCAGLAALRREGGRVLVQDEKTSVVFGMPTLRALVTTGEP